VSTGLRDTLILAVTLLGMVAFAYYYVRGVFEKDRLVSRAAAVAFVLCVVLGVVFIIRLLL
jgi:predicted PurR-regulated permease PerM